MYVASIFFVCISFYVYGMDKEDSLPNVNLGNHKVLPCAQGHCQSDLNGSRNFERYGRSTQCIEPCLQGNQFQTRSAKLRMVAIRNRIWQYNDEELAERVLDLLRLFLDTRRRFNFLLCYMERKELEVGSGNCRNVKKFFDYFGELERSQAETQRLWRQLIEKKYTLLDVAIQKSLTL